MKTIKYTTASVLLLLALFLSLSVMTTAAAGEVASNPGNAAYIDNLVHPIQANSSIWYRFDYSLGDPNNRPTSQPMAFLALRYGDKSGVGFDVWAPNQISNWTDKDARPIGKGTATTVNCDTGRSDSQGQCESANLTWAGAFGSSGTYYVRVINSTSIDSTSLLTVSGTGVMMNSTAAPAVVTGPVVSAQSSATIVSMDSPTKAIALDGKVQSIPAGSVVWYRFNYSIGDPNDPATREPVNTIKLLYGNKSGLGFDVWAPNQINDWTDKDARPIGKGTTTTVNCDTGQNDSRGQCQSADLTWSGAFGSSGAYYVRVSNMNLNAINALLTIQ